jgi:hypothetical protein
MQVRRDKGVEKYTLKKISQRKLKYDWKLQFWKSPWVLQITYNFKIRSAET